MTKDQSRLRDIKKTIVELFRDMPQLSCDDFPHASEDQHDNNGRCPVEDRHYTALAKLRCYATEE
jgi:hypothetical protein